MKPTMSSRLDDLIRELGDPFGIWNHVLRDTHHKRHGTKPSDSSVAKALTRARNVVRQARPETEDWTWTGRLYRHRRDPDVTLDQWGNYWVLSLGEERVSRWSGTYPAALLDSAAHEARMLLGVPDAKTINSWDGIREVYRYGL